MRILIATMNEGKLREYQRLLADVPDLELATMASATRRVEVEEDRDTFAGNALKKATEIAAVAGMPCLADDSGLEVDALGGRPGVHSARYSGEGATDASNNRDPIPLKFIWDASVTTSGAFIRPSENLAILAEDRPLEILTPNGNQVLGDVNPTVMGYGPVGRSVRLYFKQDGENVRTFYITVDDRGRWVLDDERWASGYYSVHELEDGFYEVRAYLAASGTGQEDEEEHIVNIEISSNAENKPIPVTEIETPARTGENAYSIEFASDQEAATFECRLNTAGAAGTWSGCSSPKSVTVPEEGVYTYEIRASLNGQTETIPAEVGFEHRNVEFAFLSPENGSATSEAMPALMAPSPITQMT